MDKRKLSPGWALAALALAILLILPATYIAGYFCAADYHQNLSQTVVIRSYDFSWEMSIFLPVAKAEQRLTGREVLLTTKKP